MYMLENVIQTADTDENTDFAQGEDRPVELVEYQGL